MNLKRTKRLVGALEFMKGEVDDAFNAYHEGTQNGVQCKQRLWASLQDAIQRLNEAAYANVGWIRIQVPHDAASAKVVTDRLSHCALTTRYVGPREEGQPAVMYVTVKARDVTEVSHYVVELKSDGFSVRDWSFGCQRGET